MDRKRIIIVLGLLLVLFPAIAVKANAAQEHYHGDILYEPWPGTAGALPRQNGYYYLTEDMVRGETQSAITIPAGVSVHLCLCGHTITHRNPEERLYTIKGSFYLEDCQENAGGIAYGGNSVSTCRNGALLQVQRGGEMTMTGGRIYGLSGADETAAAVFVQGATTMARAVFRLLGGIICDNTSAICMTPSDSFPARENFSQVHIGGGSVAGNGSAIRVTGDCLQITGGQITENQGPAVYVGERAKLLVSGQPYITGNQTGNLHLAGEGVMELGELESGAKVGVTAETPCRFISTTLGDVPADCFTSDDPQFEITVQNQALYLDSAHKHMSEDEIRVWRKWTDPQRLPAVSGDYRLEQDVLLTEEAVVEAGVILNLCLNGHSITAPEGKRIMTIASGGQVTITDCREHCGSLTGGNSDRGGGFYVMRQGRLTLYNAMLKENTANEGGGVYLQGAAEDLPGGRFEMFGGQIVGCSAKKGGGIYADAGSCVLLAGGRIGDNTAALADGIYVTDDLLVCGSVQAQGIYLAGQACITAKALNQDARLLVDAENPDRPITDGPVNESVAYCFLSENPYRLVEHKGVIYLNYSREHSHCLCGGSHESVFWRAWESSTELPMSTGYYYLLTDVILTDQVGIMQDIHLCLNGHKVTAAKGERLFQVHTGGRLTITDCAGGGLLTGGNKEHGGAINVMRGATARLYAGTIAGNSAQLGGAIYVQGERSDMAGGAFYMYGGQIAENSSYDGAIYMDGGSNIMICGGVISQNRAENHGGGIYLAAHSRADIHNVRLEGNKACKRGGGIYQSVGTELTLIGSQILQNCSGDTGSALYSEGSFLLESCYITGNTATKGTAVYVAPAADAVRRMGGDLWIWGNTGTTKADLYLGKGVIITGTQTGFGRNTKIRVQIYTGFLTDVLLAAYDYEGGNRVYTVTYGTRSLTDPEKEPAPEETVQPEKKREETQEKPQPKLQPKPEETVPAEPEPIAQDGNLPMAVSGGKGALGAVIVLASMVFTIFLLRAKQRKKV